MNSKGGVPLCAYSPSYDKEGSGDRRRSFCVFHLDARVSSSNSVRDAGVQGAATQAAVARVTGHAPLHPCRRRAGRRWEERASLSPTGLPLTVLSAGPLAIETG